MKTEVTVDGWGTLVTPDGAYDCLRLTRTLTVSFFGNDFVTETVEFVTTDGVTAVLDMTNGTASYTLATVGTAAEGGPTAATLRLDAAYPNPFATTTHLSVTLPHTADVTLAVFDLLGRRVATLADGRLPAGTQGFAWTPDATRASGLYVAVLRADGQAVSRRMVFQR
ncbi:MAG: T9SS type A sorting domain-containing protein [Bacteroidota bacterium]